MWHKTNKSLLLLSSLLLLFVVAFGVIAIVASGGGGGDGNQTGAPFINEFIYILGPTTVGSGEGSIAISGHINFLDDDRDVSSMTFSLFDADHKQLGTNTFHLDYEGHKSFFAADVFYVINTPVAGDSYIFETYITDKTNRNSNVLTGEFNIIYSSWLTFNTLGEPVSVTMGDLDGDGDLDLAVANRHTSDNAASVSVLLNNGDGTFATAVAYSITCDGYNSVAMGNLSVAMGDLDGDDDLDLAVANDMSGNILVLLNNGDGTFTTVVEDPPFATVDNPSPHDVAVGDLDGDGDLDLANVNYHSSDNAGSVTVRLNNGDGTFAGTKHYSTGGASRSMKMSDLDGDGDLDLAVVNFQNPDGPGNVTVLFNNGNGTFTTVAAYSVDGVPYSVTMGDLDGDGDLDLVMETSENISVLLNKGDGTFATAVAYPGSGPLAMGDLDGDGDLDLAVPNTTNIPFSSSVSVLLNNGDGTFATAGPYSAGYCVGVWPNQIENSSMAMGDLDGDGDLDLAVTDLLTPDRGVWLLFNNDLQ